MYVLVIRKHHDHLEKIEIFVINLRKKTKQIWPSYHAYKVMNLDWVRMRALVVLFHVLYNHTRVELVGEWLVQVMIVPFKNLGIEFIHVMKNLSSIYPTCVHVHTNVFGSAREILEAHGSVWHWCRIWSHWETQ